MTTLYIVKVHYTGEYWMASGKGTTSNRNRAYLFTQQEVAAIARNRPRFKLSHRVIPVEVS